MGKKLDVHVHIGCDYENEYTAEAAIERMDRNGIDFAVISPVPMYPAPDGLESTMRQNDYIAEALAKHPDRFLRGLGTVNPRHGREALKEVDRIFRDLGLCGLMFSNDKTGLSMDNPIMYEFIRTMPKEIHPVVLMHTSFFSVLEPPFMLEKLAIAFPDINFINASGLRDTTQSNCSRFLSGHYANIYCDTAAIHYIMHPVAKAVAEMGEDKLVFGSDAPFYDICYDKMIVEDGEVSDAVKAKIFYDTAAGLFGIEQ